MARLALTCAIAATALSLTACASDNRAVRGAAIGGAGGAVVGAVVPGIDPVTGALIGAAGGAVVGALTDDNRSNSRRYCSDRYGRGSDAYRRCRNR